MGIEKINIVFYIVIMAVTYLISLIFKNTSNFILFFNLRNQLLGLAMLNAYVLQDRAW